jgi:hypothetical protein
MKRWLIFALAVILAVAVFILIGEARAQQLCGDRAQTAEHLQKAYGEVKIADGISGAGAGVMELYASDTGSWTLLVNTPGGLACLISVGSEWQFWMPEKAKPKTEEN